MVTVAGIDRSKRGPNGKQNSVTLEFPGSYLSEDPKYRLSAQVDGFLTFSFSITVLSYCPVTLAFKKGYPTVSPNEALRWSLLEPKFVLSPSWKDAIPPPVSGIMVVIPRLARSKGLGLTHGPSG